MTEREHRYAVTVEWTGNLGTSPNAGWPEAAMASLLGLRLAGPRAYGGHSVEDAWMGEGSAAAMPADIERAIGIAWRAWGLLLLVVLGLVTL